MGRRSVAKRMKLLHGQDRETRVKLPEELVITEILCRLPTKSLLRFRCVSKSWLRLLSVDSHFINSLHLPQLMKATPSNSMICLNTSPRIRRTYFYFVADDTVGVGEHIINTIDLNVPIDRPRSNKKTPTPYYNLVGICNGLLCLSEAGLALKLSIWNPLTRDHITLSSLPLPSHLGATSYAVFGFGYDGINKQYKVVRILDCGGKGRRVSVCTLGTNLWRTLRDVQFDFRHSKPAKSAINGAPHWLVRGKVFSFSDLVVAFDIKDEIFRTIPLPIVAKFRYIKIREWGGLLSLAIRGNNQIETWVMKEYGVSDSWTKLCTINTDEIPNKFYLWKPICVDCNGEIILRSSFSSNVLMVYNTKTNSFEKPRKFQSMFNSAYSYTGSLVSPTMMNGGAKLITVREETWRGREGKS